MSEIHEAIIRRYYQDVFGAGKMDSAAIDIYLADNFVAHNLPPMREGSEDYKRFISMFVASFSDLNPVEVHDIFSRKDKVVVRWSCSGRHSAEFMGIPASNRQIRIKGIDIFRLTEGKIAELWQELDIMGILQQISAPPHS